MGDAFGDGLIRMAGLGTPLDLKGKVDGDRPTIVAGLAQLVRGLTSLDLSGNSLDAGEAEVLANGVAASRIERLRCPPLLNMNECVSSD